MFLLKLFQNSFVVVFLFLGGLMVYSLNSHRLEEEKERSECISQAISLRENMLKCIDGSDTSSDQFFVVAVNLSKFIEQYKELPEDVFGVLSENTSGVSLVEKFNLIAKMCQANEDRMWIMSMCSKYKDVKNRPNHEELFGLINRIERIQRTLDGFWDEDAHVEFTVPSTGNDSRSGHFGVSNETVISIQTAKMLGEILFAKSALERAL